MAQIDLSTLDAPELRRLLDSARRQGQAAQSYEILREMEARRQSGPSKSLRPKSLSRKRPPREPRTISLVLGDPLEPKEDPLLDPADDDLPPLRLADEPPRELPPEPPPAASKSQGWAHWGALIFAVGLAGGVAGGWWAADFANSGLSHSAGRRSAARPAVQTASLAPVLPPANAEPASGDSSVTLVPAPAAADTPSAPSGVTQVADPVTNQVPLPPAAAAHEDAAAPSSPSPPANALPSSPAKGPATVEAPPNEPTVPTPAPLPETKPSEAAPVAKAAKTAPTGDKACASQPTPADRTICADPKLRHLQTELRQAYAEALKAHEDKALLRQHELSWAEARNGVTDPEQLAKLYRERIAKLRAATADALKRHPASVTPRAAADSGP